MNPKLLVTRGQAAVVASLSRYHPIVIEGMGSYDPRDPTPVAETIVSNLQAHWESKQQCNDKPMILIIQGDPKEDRGVSAITPIVAEKMGVSRALICLDEDIADYHSRDADRSNVSMEFRYSDLVEIMEDGDPGSFNALEQRIEQDLQTKNQQRKEIGKPPLKDYFKDFALLQEVTKAACRQICADITVAHTQSHINEFSVTSFYTAGIELGLIEEADMVYYGQEESFDFDTIDKR